MSKRFAIKSNYFGDYVSVDSFSEINTTEEPIFTRLPGNILSYTRKESSEFVAEQMNKNHKRRDEETFEIVEV